MTTICRWPQADAKFIKLSGLCGSDLHVYRGHEGVEKESVKS